ncbi:MAG: diacylglycerol kinase family lipid kinase [bacterium]|nr:diacylglycerol kinase family lipid kinase [bacterium]
MRYVFIVNPKAGKGKFIEKTVAQIRSFFAESSSQYIIYYTKRAGHANELARKEASVGDEVTVFSCGGDGTNQEVINGLVGFKNVIFGVIPCGTGNDYIKSYGTRQDFLDLSAQLSGNVIDIDLIKFEDKYALNQCSCGMDAMVADNVRIFKKISKGALAYNLSVVYTFFKKFNQRLRITIDGQQLPEIPCLFAVCANGQYYGGGYRSAPTAVTYDNKLEFSVIQTRSKIRMLSILPAYIKGRHIDKNYCRYGNCSEIKIDCDKEIPVNYDGEIAYRKSVKFEIAKSAVRFLVPSTIKIGLKQYASTVKKV